MRIFYSYKQVDEVLDTLKKMREEAGALNQDYVKIIKDVLKHSYKGVVLHFYNELSKNPEILKEFESIK
jgi:NADH:ubiquinone oxidoreductase subunit E